MRFIAYSIENFKAIEDEIIVAPIKTLNVVIGPNNEGKSSIFEPLCLLKYLFTAIADSTNDAVIANDADVTTP